MTAIVTRTFEVDRAFLVLTPCFLLWASLVLSCSQSLAQPPSEPALPKTDFSMLLGGLFVLIAGAGAWSADARLAKNKDKKEGQSRK